MNTFYGWVGELAVAGWLPADFQYPFLTRGFLWRPSLAGSAIWS
jgi:hypothetical protein